MRNQDDSWSRSWSRRSCAPPAQMMRATANGVTLAVRAQPGAKKTAVIGIYGEGSSAQLKIAVQAPPIEGRANEALIAFLAEMFDLPKSAIELTAGELSRSKVFLLRGVTFAAAQSLLGPWVNHPAI
jgi:uncharacterized protein (TIGR00251 family)